MSFNINQRLNGLNPLSYLGDNAVQPPDFVTKPRPPTSNDSKNFALGDIWLDTSGYPVSEPTAEDVYMLVALIGNQATWVNFAGGVSDLNSLTGDDGVVVLPNPAGNIDILAQNATLGCGSTVLFSGPVAANTIQFDVTDSANNTCIGKNAGNLASIAGNNTFIGYASGSLTGTNISGGNNTALGYSSLSSNIDGNANVAIGTNSLKASIGGATGGGIAGNTAIGKDSGLNLITGDYNCLIGYLSGVNFTGGESSNILLGSVFGTVGESNTIRIGAQGSNPGQQNRNFQAGIYNVTPAIANPLTVVIDSAGQLGTRGSSIAFAAYLTTSIPNFTGVGPAQPIVVFDTVVYNIGSNYSTGTSTFTAPADGVYQFNAVVTISNLSADMTSGVTFFQVTGTGPSVGGWGIVRGNPYATRDIAAGFWRYAGGFAPFLNAGDTVNVRVRVSGGAGNTATLETGATNIATNFSGFKVA